MALLSHHFKSDQLTLSVGLALQKCEGCSEEDVMKGNVSACKVEGIAPA